MNSIEEKNTRNEVYCLYILSFILCVLISMKSYLPHVCNVHKIFILVVYSLFQFYIIFHIYLIIYNNRGALYYNFNDQRSLKLYKRINRCYV